MVSSICVYLKISLGLEQEGEEGIALKLPNCQWNHWAPIFNPATLACGCEISRGERLWFGFALGELKWAAQAEPVRSWQLPFQGCSGVTLSPEQTTPHSGTNPELSAPRTDHTSHLHQSLALRRFAL